MESESTLNHLKKILLLAISHLLSIGYLHYTFIECILDVSKRNNVPILVLNPQKSFLETLMGYFLGREQEVPRSRKDVGQIKLKSDVKVKD